MPPSKIRVSIASSSALHRFHHGFEIPLHGINGDGQRILQREIFAVLGQHRLERAWDNVVLKDPGGEPWVGFLSGTRGNRSI